MDDEDRRRTNRTTLETVIGAIGTPDVALVASLYTDDYVLELPFFDPEPLRCEGLIEVATALAPLLQTFKFTLSLTAVHECVDPDVLIAEYVSQGHVTTTGKPYANTYIGVWRFRDGKVCGVKEFFNPLVSQRALADE